MNHSIKANRDFSANAEESSESAETKYAIRRLGATILVSIHNLNKKRVTEWNESLELLSTNNKIFKRGFKVEKLTTEDRLTTL